MPSRTPQGRGLGWTVDRPDHRDYLYTPSTARGTVALPPRVDLRPGMPPVYDQGRIGSCTANAIAGAWEYTERRQFGRSVTPSRLGIYFCERALRGQAGSDSGAQIRDGFRVIHTTGVWPETAWPYDDTPADPTTGVWETDPSTGVVPRPAQQPPAADYVIGKSERSTVYERVTRDLQHIRGCLAAGWPVVFGFTVYESFESGEVARSGDAPMPSPSEQVLGGHAVTMVGYDDDRGRVLVRNSWGSGWGDGGYFTLPYAYLTTRGLPADFWTLRAVTV